MILTPLQTLPNNVGDLGEIIVDTSFEWLPKVQKIAKSGHTASQNVFSNWSLVGVGLQVTSIIVISLMIIKQHEGPYLHET